MLPVLHSIFIISNIYFSKFAFGLGRYTRSFLILNIEGLYMDDLNY